MRNKLLVAGGIGLVVGGLTYFLMAAKKKDDEVYPKKHSKEKPDNNDDNFHDDDFEDNSEDEENKEDIGDELKEKTSEVKDKVAETAKEVTEKVVEKIVDKMDENIVTINCYGKFNKEFEEDLVEILSDYNILNLDAKTEKKKNSIWIIVDATDKAVNPDIIKEVIINKLPEIYTATPHDISPIKINIRSKIDKSFAADLSIGFNFK